MNYLLIGKPNVGKSSIFNLLISSNQNITHKDSGTTRDWHKGYINGSSSYIFDTPGVFFDENKKVNLSNLIINKIEKIDINSFLYVIDYKDGFNEVDKFRINILRKYNKEIILIINKFDNIKLIQNKEILKYGIKKIVYISCSHNYGLDNLKSLLNLEFDIPRNENYDYSFAIIGKPNVGKSTFLNTLIGYNRSNTDSKANTTTDLVIDYIKFKNKIFKVIDSAGIGRKSKVKNSSINYYAIKKSFLNIHKVDLSLILVDSKKGIDRQDKRIIKLVSAKSKLMMIIYNKFDLIIDKNTFKIKTINAITGSFSEIKNVKIFFISAFNRRDINKILKYLFNLMSEESNNFSTSKLNKWLKKTTSENQHPLIENKRVNFKYAVQIKNKPLTIKIFCNYSTKIKSNYKKYLINSFNLSFAIINQKTNFIFTSAKNPYI